MASMTAGAEACRWISRSRWAAATSSAWVRTSMLGFCRVVRAKRSSRNFRKRLIFFLPGQANTCEREKQLYVRMGTCENVVAIWPDEVQFWYLVARVI